MLYGGLDKIRHQFAKPEIIIKTGSVLPEKIKGVTDQLPENDHFRLKIENGVSAQAILKELVKQNIILEEFEIAVPSLDEIFIQVVQGGRG